VKPRRLLLALAAATAVAACAPAGNTATTPWCDDFGVLILEAQSVPGAGLLPCVDLMPLGWNVGATEIDDRGTVFTLNSSIAGAAAATVRLAPSCDVTGHVQVPTDEAGTARYEYVSSITGGFRGLRTYVFDGGCTSIEFDFTVEASAALVNEVSLAVGFVPRDAANDAVREVTGGREQIDPEAD
jgi:hypothetical protein